MDRLDEAMEAQEKVANERTKQYLTESMRIEEDNKVKILNALERARGYLTMGNRKNAVQMFESIQEYISWQTEFGGEIWLEYGMALETVDRIEEARKIYSKLINDSWSAIIIIIIIMEYRIMIICHH